MHSTHNSTAQHTHTHNISSQHTTSKNWSREWEVQQRGPNEEMTVSQKQARVFDRGSCLSSCGPPTDRFFLNSGKFSFPVNEHLIIIIIPGGSGSGDVKTAKTTATDPPPLLKRGAAAAPGGEKARARSPCVASRPRAAGCCRPAGLEALVGELADHLRDEHSLEERLRRPGATAKGGVPTAAPRPEPPPADSDDAAGLRREHHVVEHTA